MQGGLYAKMDATTEIDVNSNPVTDMGIKMGHSNSHMFRQATPVIYQLTHT